MRCNLRGPIPTKLKPYGYDLCTNGVVGPMSPAWSVSSLKPVVDSSLSVLEQCGRFIAELDDASYTVPCSVIAGSTVGQHVRHSLDHFAAALSALDGQLIDYDRRERDTPVEQSRDAALHLVSDLRRRLGTIREGDLSWPVRVRVMINGEGDEVVLGSTMARELAFAMHHAIHHHAMMAAISKELGVTPEQGFGRAPSTVRHDRSVQASEAGSIGR